MGLKLQLRRAGDVAVFQCEGPIVLDEAQSLEERMGLELQDGTKYFVLEVSAVPRVDSSGLGLMVRLLMRARKAGGDLKLACPPPFVTNLLAMTRLSTLFQVFPAEREAVVSYRKPAPEVSKPASSKGRIIFLDQSFDLCAFVRTVLTANGYEVLSTTVVREARILLQVGNTDVLLLGPNTSRFASKGQSLRDSLAGLAPKVTIVELDKQFPTLEAEQAGTVLLQLLRKQETRSASATA